MINLIDKKDKNNQINDDFLLQEDRSKKIHGVAKISTYKDQKENYLIKIKPGFAFPSKNKMFDKDSINNKLSFASCFSDDLKDVKVKNVTQPIKGKLEVNENYSIYYEQAKYYVENKGKVDVFDTLISEIDRQIMILTRKNKQLDNNLISKLKNLDS